ncbi:MAG TPA: hypothetical protein VKZ79_04010 [Alphaproteobacteria bacterium]|nr:hypothetical protein [Alphaproteobacteria bacterium]
MQRDRARRLMLCELTKDPSARALYNLHLPVPPLVLKPGSTVAISRAGGFGLLHGWFPLEDWGAWGSGTDSTLIVHLVGLAGPGPYRLRFRGRAVVVDHAPDVMIDVFAADQEVGHWRFNVSNNYDARDICVPAAAIDANGILMLRFHDPQPRVPAAFGVNNDTRLLSMGIDSLELASDQSGICP